MNRSLFLSLLAFSLLFVGGCDAEVEGDEEGECSDGVDNDQDGPADCDDPGCKTATSCVVTDDTAEDVDSPPADPESGSTESAQAVQPEIKEAGETKATTVEAWNKLVISGPITVGDMEAPPFTVRVTGGSALCSKLSTSVVNGVLTIGVGENINSSCNLDEVEVHISMPRRLQGLTLSDESSLEVTGGIKTSAELVIELDGASKLVASRIDAASVVASVKQAATWLVHDLRAKQLEARISGAGSMEVFEGAVRSFELQASGAAKVDTQGMEASSVHLEAAGAPRVVIRSNKKLQGSMSGVSYVRYSGDGEVNIDVKGAASLDNI